MFRKTMAMLADRFARSEIALGIQFKHIATRALANRGYAAPDATWAKHLDDAVHAAQFRRLKDLYGAHARGEEIGSAPERNVSRPSLTRPRPRSRPVTGTQGSRTTCCARPGSPSGSARSATAYSTSAIRVGLSAWRTRSSPKATPARWRAAASPTAAPTA